MSFKTEEESVYLKRAEIWNKIKVILNVKFYSQPIYDDKYIKTKVKTFNNTINTLFSGVAILKKEFIMFVFQPSVLILYSNYPQVCLEQCKHKIKKIELVSFIDDELSLSSDDSHDLDE